MPVTLKKVENMAVYEEIVTPEPFRMITYVQLPNSDITFQFYVDEGRKLAEDVLKAVFQMEELEAEREAEKMARDFIKRHSETSF